ncbi:MAG: hypothetical protein HXX09_02795 [Bacteroidetes bacterium]|nr:hypothetical protein [Bacteroidota bacterium]
MNQKSILKITTIAVFVLFIALIGGCAKNKYSKIEGTWNKVNVVDENGIINEQWLFNSDRTLTVSNRNSNDEFIPTDKGSYEILAKIDKTEMKLSGFSGKSYYVGTWQIITLKKDKLVIVLPGPNGHGLYTIEFTKLQ